MRTAPPHSRPVSAGRQRAAEQPAEAEGGGQPADRPEDERAVDERDHRVGDQVGRVALLARRDGCGGTATPCARAQAAQRAAQAAAVVDVRAVGVAWLVGERVVLAVVGHPRDDRALDRRRPETREDAAHPGFVAKRGGSDSGGSRR